MPPRITSGIDPLQPAVYRIRVRGHLDRVWAERFGGMAVTLEDNGETSLTGTVADQAALYGLLRKVRDLGLPLVSVNYAGTCRKDIPKE
jgi:hypothetical protein